MATKVKRATEATKTVVARVAIWRMEAATMEMAIEVTITKLGTMSVVFEQQQQQQKHKQ